MTFFSKIFSPTKNRRLNELVGFLLCVSALLLFLALASYSPLDPSLNSASILTGSHAARNWVGILGAYLSDITLQFWGVGSFLLPVFMALLGARWFRSRTVQTPVAKTLGSVWLLMFVPALLAILPGHVRWMGSIPIEGLVGRIVGDVLIRYLNVAGAYIVCTTVLAVALYLTTAFSFSAIELWMPTRFAFVVALKERFKDWQIERERQRQQKELEKRRAEKPVVTTQLFPAVQRQVGPKRRVRILRARNQRIRRGRFRECNRLRRLRATELNECWPSKVLSRTKVVPTRRHLAQAGRREWRSKSRIEPTRSESRRRLCRRSLAATSCHPPVCCIVPMSNKRSMKKS